MTTPPHVSVPAFARAVVRTARWRVGRAVLLTIGLGVMSAGSGLLLVPLVASVGLDTGASGRGITQVFTRMLAFFGQPLTVGWALAAFVLVMSAQALLTRWARLAEDAVELEVIRFWRTGLFGRFARVDWAYYSRYRASDLVEVLVEQVDRVGVGARHLLRLVCSGVIAVAYLVVAIRLSVFTTALAISGAGLLVVALSGWRRRTRALGKEQNEAWKTMYAVLSESLGAMKTIRAYNGEVEQEARLGSAVDRMHAIYRDLVRADSASRQIFEIGSVVMLSVVAYVALVLRGTPPAELFVLLFVFARVAPQVSALHNQYQQVLAEAPAFGRLLQIEAEAAAHDDGTERGARPIGLADHMRLDRVTFAYPGATVLHDVTLRVAQGETVAVVGPSGAGKSTLADVVLGLLAPQSGRLIVDDVAVDPSRVAAWRAELGYVAQDGVLFHDTVRANLLLGAPAASDGDLRAALEASAAWSFVSALPQGLDTVVGDRGVLLSGGERQRLALARALLRQPRLLVLDEATSSLDSENERVIADAIDRLHGRTSILVITHRLATVRHADVIYVLDAGRVVESGTWDDLLGRRGRFHALCLAQGIAGPDEVARRRPYAISGA
jgi:ATP-binding cassette subfamily C protein